MSRVASRRQLYPQQKTVSAQLKEFPLRAIFCRQQIAVSGWSHDELDAFASECASSSSKFRGRHPDAAY
jgi:hypothetical protein